MTFVSFEVEKPYPGPMPTMEGLTATPDGASIRLVIALGGLAGEEIQTIRKGGMEFALYIERRIPFIALAFPAINLDMDCHFNLLVEPQHKRDALLGDEPNANLIHIHLIDTRTLKLKAMRGIGLPVPMMTAFKMALFDQLTAYKDAAAVDRAAGDIRSRITTRAMLQKGDRYDFPAR